MWAAALSASLQPHLQNEKNSPKKVHPLSLPMILSHAEIAEPNTATTSKVVSLSSDKSDLCLEVFGILFTHNSPDLRVSGDVRYWRDVEMILLICPSHERTEKATRN